MVVARKFDKLRVRNALSHVLAGTHVYRHVADSMQYERRNVNCCQDMANVDVVIHSCQRKRGRRTCPHAQESGPPLPHALVVRDTWRAKIEADRPAPAVL